VDHCRKCLAYYPKGFRHQCVPWIAALVQIHAEEKGQLDRPHSDCQACFPDGNCPADCIARNHKPAE
jgi:hypothetical protein